MLRSAHAYMAAALALACGACSSQKADDADQRPVLAVSIEPQRKILEAVAGPAYKVVTILPAGANPETFEPTVAQRMQAADAKAYFTLGFMPFESILAEQMGRNGRVYNSAARIAPVMDTHSHGNHTHSVPDPHVWTSLRNAQTIAANMADALAAFDPANAEAYAHRADSLCAVLDSLDQAVADKLQGAPRAFAVWHPSLSYFARDYGLRQISVGQESKEAPVSQLAGVIQEAKADSVRVFFFQKEYDSRQAQSINAEIGSRLITINPLDYEWEQQLIDIADAIARD